MSICESHLYHRIVSDKKRNETLTQAKTLYGYIVGNVLNRQIHRWETDKAHKISFWGNELVLKLTVMVVMSNLGNLLTTAESYTSKYCILWNGKVVRIKMESFLSVSNQKYK
jgi:hypothetical protein